MPMSLTGLILSLVMRRVWIYAGLTPFVVFALFPVFWMIITAFKHERELYSMRGVPFWFYEGPTLDHFRLLFTQTWFGSWVANTASVSACVVGITLITAVPAAYALARLRLPGATNTAIVIFLTYLVRRSFSSCRSRTSSAGSACSTHGGRWSSCIRRSRFRLRRG